jgi:hypothetical protein
MQTESTTDSYANFSERRRYQYPSFDDMMQKDWQSEIIEVDVVGSLVCGEVWVWKMAPIIPVFLGSEKRHRR